MLDRKCILFGWMSRVVWHLHSHVPIRHLWLLITSQPLGLHRSGSHTWLHLDYILPLASLIWLFMGQAALSKGWPNLSQLLGKHALKQKQVMKPSMTSRHVSAVFQSIQRWTFEISLVLDIFAKSHMTGCFSSSHSVWTVSSNSAHTTQHWAHPACASRGGIEAILKILKKEKALKLLNIWVTEIMPGSHWPQKTWQIAALLRCCCASY